MTEETLMEDILKANEEIAALNRSLLDGSRTFAVNLMSSPGAGKTSLILETIKRLGGRVKIGVIEGDVASNLDAQKVAECGVPVHQINTRGDCHLDARMLNAALRIFPLSQISLLLIENVGNLICPAEFKLGEHMKVLVSSVPEGDDKPYKYPLMFSEVDVVVLNKIDLLPYMDFDFERFRRGVEGLNSRAKIFRVSCRTGEGIEAWINWILRELESFERELEWKGGGGG